MTGPPELSHRVRLDRPEMPARLDFLDGLRGLAALYVVAFHAAEWVDWNGVALQRRPRHGAGALAHGHAAVGVFIILSGFCLMRPVVASGGALAGGFVGYLRRRARRILPPYYAATLLSLAAIAAVPSLGRPSGTAWDHCIPAFRSPTLLAHALLTHNLDLRHRTKINTPHWSVATEWQIYFALPLLVVARKRLGPAAMVSLAIVVGILPHLLLPPGRNYDTACPWYLGLFAIGMAAAVVERSTRRDHVPWRWLAALGCTGMALVLLNPQYWAAEWKGDPLSVAGRLVYWGRPLWVRDAVVGLVTSVVILALARDHAAGRRSVALALLQARPVLALGTISYSLYLTHYPVLALVHAGLGGGRSSADAVHLMATGVPAALLVAVVFYRIVERRFVASKNPAATPRFGRAGSRPARVGA
jgi:peptidoglycan/LPS O-acetylase OafA/YrhL